MFTNIPDCHILIYEFGQSDTNNEIGIRNRRLVN